jgi:hypothetical protein
MCAWCDCGAKKDRDVFVLQPQALFGLRPVLGAGT